MKVRAGWRLRAAMLVGLAPIVFLAGSLAFDHPARAATVAPLPLISRGVPAFSNDTACAPATDADDASYDTQWHACNIPPSPATPVWIAYDLSGVPATQRGPVLVAWDSVAWDSVAWDSVAWDAFTFD